ncbi:hypothetical protein HC928_15255 [bacterium]|nr:hypothetical protein [bacterium]
MTPGAKRSIPPTYVGQISVLGECFCFGAALDQTQLAQGKPCSIQPPSGEGRLRRLERKIEGVGIYHLVLLHRSLVEPRDAERSVTYLFLADKNQATAKLGAHVQQLVDLAVFSRLA